jgi:two-component system LytT family response regulator
MNKIRTVIIDDEPLARAAVRILLKRDPEIDIVGECGDGASAVKLIRKVSPDLVFLDIQMPRVSGFDVLDRLELTSMPIIIFITAFDQYAIKAFDVHALDYLLKPFTDERFERSLERAKQQVRDGEIGDLGRRLVSLAGYVKSDLPENDALQIHKSTEPYTGRFMIKRSGRIFFIKATEIDWIEAADYYVKLHAGKASHLLRERMHNLERGLDPDQFIRVHRSAIVNIDRIRELQQMFNGEYSVVLNNGTELKLSRSYRERIQAALLRNS